MSRTAEQQASALIDSLRAALQASRDTAQAMQDRASDLAASLCNARARLDEVRATHARLVAACRKLGVTAPGDLRHWSLMPDAIAEFDAALAACEEVRQ